MSEKYAHLPHIKTLEELKLYELIPDVVWIFDVDKHGWWWGNQAALKFWGLESLEQLINKDLSGDTQGARDRTVQTFELANVQGLTIDPWTTYPNGKPKTLYMRHRACLVGPNKHRAIIAYINETVDLGESPENLLLVEATRYTKVLVTSFQFDGTVVTENPAATEAYPHELTASDKYNVFEKRFVDIQAGSECLQLAIEQNGGRWTHEMNTALGVRKHTLDIRKTRHPLTGDFLLLVAEYDVTDLHAAIDEADKAKAQLQKMAHYDALTQLPNLRLFEEKGAALLAQAKRNNSQLAIIFADLDGFKSINDNYGHATGDKVLREVADRLSSELRESDLVARIGGDEFVILQANLHNQQEAENLASKIISIVSRPYQLAESQAKLGVSLGIAFYPNHGDNLSTLLVQADQAMYRVKHQGKNNYVFVDG
ncbi:diguanylate cyclase domain-containing protein [Catenovulum sp. SX2]|uniref:diguanylate cyclase domain-containing protein n=1 Tax=Catenovulum sp. SX2 TaxID=3398614 RepID=UPI003F87E282